MTRVGHPPERGRQRITEVDAQLVNGTGVDRPVERQGLGLLTGGAHRGAEGGLHWFVKVSGRSRSPR